MFDTPEFENRPRGSKVISCQTQKIHIFTRFSRVNNSVESGDFEKVPRRDLPPCQISGRNYKKSSQTNKQTFAH